MFITKHVAASPDVPARHGRTLALPLLDAMVPALTATAQTAAQPARRLGFIYVPHGVIMDQWTPATDGAGFEFTPILKPLEPFRDIADRRQQPRAAGGRLDTGPRRAPASWLTGVASEAHRRRRLPSRASRIDQIVAEQIGQDTPFPSLEVATEDFTALARRVHPGYSCAYMNTLSWRTPTTPLPMEINPRVVFERMFGGASTAGPAAGAHARQTAASSTSSARIWPDLERTHRAGAIARALDEYSTTSARSNGGSSRRRSSRLAS